MSPAERKLAFQDGIRAAIGDLHLLAEQAMAEGKAEDYLAIERCKTALRDSLDHDAAPGPLDAEARLWWTAQVFRSIVEHAREGGSFRQLIYGRLGFDVDAYAPLYLAGGMTISNEFILAEAGEEDRVLLLALDAALGKQDGSLPVGELRTFVVQARYRLEALSKALATEQDRRKTLEREFAIERGLATQNEPVVPARVAEEIAATARDACASAVESVGFSDDGVVHDPNWIVGFSQALRRAAKAVRALRALRTPFAASSSKEPS